MNKKNPLYVVTQKGRVVEEAKNIVDALIKKLGLTPTLELCQSILQTWLKILQDFVSNYARLQVINQCWTEFESWWQNMLQNFFALYQQWMPKANNQSSTITKM
jgi:hypothetical protein